MTKMSNPLPWDFCRCQPQQVDEQCKNCRRWTDQEGQTFGPRTAFVQVPRSKSEACAYLPISFLKENT